jgi:beta-xylosidase
MKSKMPDVGKKYPVAIPQTTDEFNSTKLGLQWQWHANPKKDWYSLTDIPGKIKLNAVQNVTQYGNLWLAGNLLMQKFPAPAFTATTKVEFSGDLTGDRCGLVVMGRSWAYLALVQEDNATKVAMFTGSNQKCDNQTHEEAGLPIESGPVYLKVTVKGNDMCQFGYSQDNGTYLPIGEEFKATEGVWIGAKVGIFCMNPNITESKGFAGFDWFRLQ